LRTAAPRINTSLQFAAIALLAVCIGAAVGRDPRYSVLLLGLAAAGGAVAWAIVRPAPAFAVMLATLAFVPVYASPLVHNFTVELTAFGLWLIVVAEGLKRLGRPRTLRFTFVDGAVAVFVAALAVPVFASVRTPKDFATPLFLWLGPYLAARLTLGSTQRLFGFLRMIAVLAIFTVPFVLWEYLSGSNPFTRLSINPVEASVWAHPQTRFGQTRPSAAFGHPLALSMFLVSASLFCLALWLASRDERRRRWWLIAAAITFAAQALTLSRTGWIMAAAGVSLLAFIRFGSDAKLRLMAMLGAVAAVLVVAISALPAERSVVLSITGSGQTQLAAGAQYRKSLGADALRPGVLHLAGNRKSPFVQSVLTPFGFYQTQEESLDNSYIFLADGYGLVTLGAFLLLGLSVAVLFLRLRTATTLAALPAVVLANLVALYFVAFITQQQVFFWLLVGACGALAQLFPRRTVSGP
jgi:hypothetical protein